MEQYVVLGMVVSLGLFLLPTLTITALLIGALLWYLKQYGI